MEREKKYIAIYFLKEKHLYKPEFIGLSGAEAPGLLGISPRSGTGSRPVSFISIRYQTKTQ